MGAADSDHTARRLGEESDPARGRARAADGAAPSARGGRQAVVGGWAASGRVAGRVCCGVDRDRDADHAPDCGTARAGGGSGDNGRRSAGTDRRVRDVPTRSFADTGAAGCRLSAGSAVGCERGVDRADSGCVIGHGDGNEAAVGDDAGERTVVGRPPERAASDSRGRRSEE
ncbi:hypothetical protein [Halohasta salina]|uniref:hypothetical protein n=1 Tax=Halohasta salina TaxID=2961621 RepID=UPI0020A2A32E|nr:hypothetical protein [Halohasta salina]